jgi:regulator of protease activity HflC (stomatin/prohibitin superfamily)
MIKSMKDQRGISSVTMGFGLFGVCVIGLIAFIVFLGWVSAFKGTDPGDVCVVKQGGPFDGRSISQVRPGGEGPSNIGMYNKQLCFPANQRNYIVSSDPNNVGDAKTVDFVEVQTKDAQTVRVNGQALFTLNTDSAVIKEFYKRFGTRTFDGHHPYDGGSGWDAFLRIQFRPILDNALREAVGSFNCTELNNSCQYVTQAQEAVKGNVQQVNTGQNLDAAQTNIEAALVRDLNSTLGTVRAHGQNLSFFTGIHWRFSGSGQGGAIAFKPGIQQQIENAQAKQTQVATARLDAQKRVAAAKGDTQVASQQAQQIRLKAKAYTNNPQQAEIDKLKALCGPDGCSNLQVLGGNATKLLSK